MDEAYMDFADMDAFPDTIGMFREGRRNIVIVRTLSKAFGLAGFRVGYGIGDESMISLINRIKLPFNVSIVSQHAALGALSDNTFLIKTLENTSHGRSLIYKALERLGLAYVRSSTNFILIDTGRDGDLVTEELMKRGVIVRSAKNYGMPTCIRVTVGTEAQNRRFINALSELFKGENKNI
jgi:histidinol-phosphate aminotransferase